VIRKVMKDIDERDAPITEENVREKLIEFYEVATRELTD
jgi:hypothetical protein